MTYPRAPQRSAAELALLPDDTAITAREAAAFDSISIATVWRQVERGEKPRPYYPSPRTPRWLLGELREAREKNRRLPREAKELRRRGRLHQFDQNSAP